MPGKRKTAPAIDARPSGDTLAVGRIVRPHGVRGAMLLEPYSELVSAVEPGSRVLLGEERTAATVVTCRRHGARYLLELKGHASHESAERWRDAELRIPADKAPPLPPDTYFHWQLLGLSVVTEDGTVLGQLAEILTTGANDVYLVRGDREVLLPATSEVIRQVDPASGRLIVHLLPGLID
jgi:16S rRNA processing protein RimM